MKNYKTLLFSVMLLASLAQLSPLLLTGCGSTSQQKTTFNSLYSVEHTADKAYRGYVNSVLSGDTGTNGLPAVSRSYNTFQASFLLALDAAQYQTNALAPASLVVESQDLLNLIAQFTKRK